MPTITLPILEALDYLYARNLTIDKLWVEDEVGPYPRLYRTRRTHAAVKPRDNASPAKPSRSLTLSIHEHQQALTNCVVCKRPKWNNNFQKLIMVSV